MRNKPRIRFKGFTEDWEQRKLGEFVKIVSGDAPSTFISGNCVYVKVDDLNYSDRIQLSSSNLVNANPKAHLVNQGATIFPKRGAAIMTNKVRIMGKDGYLDTNMMALIPEEIDKDFLFTFIQKTGLYKIADTSTIPQINNKHIEPYMIQVPSEKEQAYIGVVFKKIDKIITLHQRKLEKLKLAKKALLQKLFPKNGSKFPELRFKGFADAWEQRKLCQITTRVTRKNGDQSDLPLTISAQDGLVDQRKYFNRQVASRDMSNYYLIKKGEFAYNKSYSEGYPFGAVKRLDYYDIGALSTLYILFEITDNNISSDFIVSYYMTHLWYKEISKRAAEGARNHGLLNISTEDFFDSELNIPNSIEEQVKIGNFIKQFDKFITLHQ
ncbi:restriction endonuclease subunit S [Veillonella sp.]|uniref:restriction endonuclease subunit S n=1 Tax=Veillonella sp. TaxID=1926307 RepID=UPI002914B62C|nr:restriction endonuclease subunit S [Veillonella sp.]MDU3433223.1 restriction endonuclease subunit S [Veillonella sp.]